MTFAQLHWILKDLSGSTDETFGRWCKDGMKFLKPYVKREKGMTKIVEEREAKWELNWEKLRDKKEVT